MTNALLKEKTIKITFLSCVLTLFLGSLIHASTERPNVIIILTDDHGYADLGIQGLADDIKTPHLDCLAKGGALMTDGYATAPQCSPSRAGIVSGRYQSRFGLEENKDKPMSLNEVTIAERLQKAGYATGFVGKWHLSPDHLTKKWIAENRDKAGTKEPFMVPEIMLPYRPISRGFDDCFEGVMSHYFCNYDLKGNDISPPRGYGNKKAFRIDIQTEAALSFIRRHSKEPFFLHLAYFAPHVPCEENKKYFDRFPGEMSERRRWALASISAIDDGVGKVMTLLNQNGLSKNTLIFFFSDNGAPLKINMKDSPFDKPGWDGSLNGPMVGEKGMISEGGIRIPYIAHWKGTIPPQVYKEPVSTLDAGATALALAGVKTKPGDIDGVDLMPYLTHKTKDSPHDILSWRWGGQSAIRQGKWKLFELENGVQMLFDLKSKDHENKNLIKQFPEIASRMATQLSTWRGELHPPGFARSMNIVEDIYFKHYFGIEVPKRTVPSVVRKGMQRN